eukprot:7085324-Pyramimonas_sp.AAC.1
MRFLTFCGDERCRIADIYMMLLVEHYASRSGPVPSLIDAILLPSGKRLSDVSSEETVGSTLLF